MAPINLDDIIHYRPPVKKTHFKPLQVPGHYVSIHSQSSLDRPAPAHSPLHSQQSHSNPPFSGHTPHFQGSFNASDEVETSLAPIELLDEVTLNCSNGFDMDFFNASSGRDATVAVSNVNTASRDLPENVSSNDSGLSLYD
jgi:hypothetical protein